MFGIAWLNLLLILFLCVAIMRFVMKKSRRILQTKYLYRIVIVYCLIGMGSFVYLLFSTNEITKLSIEEEERLFAEAQQIQEHIFSNQIDKIDPAFVKEKKVVTAAEKELHLSTVPETVRGVIAYRDDPNSNEIEMTVYKLLSTIDYHDVTNYFNPVNLDIVDQTLYVTTKVENLRIVELNGQILTVEQEGYNGKGFHSINGQNVVHLSVPSHIKIYIENEDFEVLN